MKRLIDKDNLVAEIEKCYNECLKRDKITDSDYWNSKADAYRNVLAILNDTIEVKEVDIAIPNIDDLFKEDGIDPNSKTAKIFKESYYMALERFKEKKGE